jgi:hypothetical protein
VCSNRCVFCGQEGLPAAPEPDLDVELRAARRATDFVTFVGGEPTLAPRLSEAVALAKSLGFRRIALQTNGAELDTPRARALGQAGVTDVHVTLLGADARVHDYHSGIPGSFVRAVGALDAAQEAGLVRSVTTVVTRSNFRVLSALPRLLGARGVGAWMLAFPRHAGRARVAADRVVPRYGLAVPFVLHAMEAAMRAGLPSVVSGVPSCLLGPYAARALPEEARVFAEGCSTCEARDACPGVDAEYLARFEGDELSSVEKVARALDVLALAPLFAGHGELAPPLPDAPHRVPAARRELPMLGKVKPARDEASAGTARRSGEALREIFPALFEDGDAAEKKAGTK